MMRRRNYINMFPFEQRKAESKRILEKYPNRVPIICERINKTVPELDKRKYLVPNDLNIGAFMFVIRKRMNISSDKSIFLFVNDSTLVPIGQNLKQIYEEHKNKDEFLYIKYGGESTFG
jgi:GABA(A) receptor-associated protein